MVEKLERWKVAVMVGWKVSLWVGLTEVMTV
jgi:hypothetical protein